MPSVCPIRARSSFFFSGAFLVRQVAVAADVLHHRAQLRRQLTYASESLLEVRDRSTDAGLLTRQPATRQPAAFPDKQRVVTARGAPIANLVVHASILLVGGRGSWSGGVATS